MYLANFGDNSSGDQGIGIYYGNYGGGYGRIRFYQSGSNHSTIHSFSNSWQGGSLAGHSAGAINISGNTGVTFGDWNNVDMWTDRSGNMQTRGSMRSPVFYDSNNTGYYLNGDTSGGWRVGTPSGYLDFGPLNSGFCHFQTDRSRFYFNTRVEVDGEIWRYNGQRFVENNGGTWSISITGNSESVGGFSAGTFYRDLGFGSGFPSWNLNTVDSNRSGFTYSNGAPYTGPFIHIGASGYGLQFNAPYGGDGYGLTFRTRNGDNGTWNNWKYPAVYGVLNGGGSLNATIYYDQDNTGYYVDPASTSNFVLHTDASSW